MSNPEMILEGIQPLVPVVFGIAFAGLFIFSMMWTVDKFIVEERK